MTQAVRAARLSAWVEDSMFSSTASDPLPDIGRISINGVHSAGKPSADVKGSSRPLSACEAPDPLNISIAVISSISVGQSSAAVFRFSIAPS